MANRRQSNRLKAANEAELKDKKTAAKPEPKVLDEPERTNQTDQISNANTHDSISSPVEPKSKRRKVQVDTCVNVKKVEESYHIVSDSQLKAMVTNLVCKECHGEDIEMVIVKLHLDTELQVKCKTCKYPVPATKTKLHPITMMMVYLSMLLGIGRTGLVRLCTGLGIGTLSTTTYSIYATHITETGKRKAQECLANINYIKRLYRDELGRDPDENGILDVDVRYDLPWIKNGHNANFGFACLTDAHTGLILDYEVITTYCTVCNKWEALRGTGKVTEKEFQEKIASHQCESNHEGEPEDMELTAAEYLWSRSLEQQLRYTTIVSDRESLVLQSLQAMNDGNGPYGLDYMVIQEESIDHLTNRFSTALQHLRDNTGPGYLTGRFELCDDNIAYMTNFFGMALCQSVGYPLEHMRNAAIATFYHFISNDSAPRHDLCPKSVNSWCFYNKARAEKNKPESHLQMEVCLVLSPVKEQEVLAVYQECTTNRLLKTCSSFKFRSSDPLQRLVRMYCPEVACKRSVDFAVATAISIFSNGHAKSFLGPLLGINSSQLTVAHLETMDKDTNRKRTKKTTFGKGEVEVH